MLSVLYQINLKSPISSIEDKNTKRSFCSTVKSVLIAIANVAGSIQNYKTTLTGINCVAKHYKKKH